MKFAIGDTIKYKNHKRNGGLIRLLGSEKFFICDIGYDDSLSFIVSESIMRIAVFQAIEISKHYPPPSYNSLPDCFMYCRNLLTERV